MTLNPDLFLKARLETNEYGSWQTSIFTPDNMIEEIKGINEDYKKLYETDDDIIKVIDYKKSLLKKVYPILTIIKNFKKILIMIERHINNIQKNFLINFIEYRKKTKIIKKIN